MDSCESMISLAHSGAFVALLLASKVGLAVSVKTDDAPLPVA